MRKFKVYIPCNYVEGYLRGGHLEGVIEAESIEEVKQMSPEDLRDFCDLEVENYSVNGYEANYDGIEIEEIKKDTAQEANKVKIEALEKAVLTGQFCSLCKFRKTHYWHFPCNECSDSIEEGNKRPFWQFDEDEFAGGGKNNER